jgi:hypothetical protein
MSSTERRRKSKSRGRYKSPQRKKAFPCIQRGDHIYRPIRNGYGIQHHGIYIGNNRVVHFAGGITGAHRLLRNAGKENESIIQETSLSEFMDDFPVEKLKIFDYAGIKTSTPETTLKRAMSLIGQGEYSLALKNCEHFAIWCKTGKWYSQQVKEAYEFLKHTGRLLQLPVPSWEPMHKQYKNLQRGLKQLNVNILPSIGDKGFSYY